MTHMYLFYFYPKSIGKDPEGGLRLFTARNWVKWEELEPEDLLDSDDLMRQFQCSRATLYRYVSQWKLKPKLRIGNEMFFQAGEVKAWIENGRRPQWGGARNRREVK